MGYFCSENINLILWRNYPFITLLLFFSLVGFRTMAQDVIVLKNGAEIQAFVQEIGIDNVKYKKIENPDGPNYTMRQSDIVMIRFANGSREVFSENEESETGTINRQNRPQNRQDQPQDQQDPAMDYAAFTQLRKNDIAMEDFLWENDEALYNQFHKGVKLRRTGKGLLGAGLGATFAGLGMIIGGNVIFNRHCSFLPPNFFFQ